MYIVRVQAACDHFCIKYSNCISTIDHSGAPFQNMVGRSLRQGYGFSERVLMQIGVRMEGKKEIVTVMPVFSAPGVASTPVIVFPGKQAHYRRGQR